MDLKSFFNALRETTPSEAELLTVWLPQFLGHLGIGSQYIRYEYPVLVTETRLRVADAAIVADDRTAIVGVEVGTNVRLGWTLELTLRGMREQQITTGMPYMLLFSPNVLVVLEMESDRRIAVADVGESELEALKAWSAEVLNQLEVHRRPKRFFVEATDCMESLRKVEQASTADEKRRTLEEFIAQRIAASPGIRVKHQNLRTSSSEIDFVVENVGTPTRTVFDEHGRHFLVECKNWSDPAGAKEVRDFVGKLVKVGATLGLLVSKNGVTGRNGAEDALREIRFCYDHLRTAVVVLSLEDLRVLCLGTPLSALVDAKLDRLRFDLS